MSEEQQYIEPELELSAIVSVYNGKPKLTLQKYITAPDKIKLLASLILNEEYIPCRIVVKDKLRFYANLKEKGII